MTQLSAPHQARVILASASPRRVALLDQLGVRIDEIIPADIDEASAKGELPSVYAQRMAFEKTAKISADYPECFVIGADTVVACGRRILPKAETVDVARDCIGLMMGRAHRVYGGLALAVPHQLIQTKLSHSHVHMRRLDHAEMAQYLDQGDWHGKAGGYAIQGAAAEYITKIQGSYSQIMGLDLYLMAKMLKGAGFARR